MYISKETIDLIRDRISIEEVIKKYVPSLKKKGKNYSGLCPFHKETAPSFTVAPDKQIFYCFGCHAGGNVFSFLSKIEGVTFPESVKIAAGIVGIEIEYDKNDSRHKESEKPLAINQLALEQYHAYIKSPQGKAGLDYLLNRGVSKQSIVDFKLGYAPDSWNFLTNTFKKRNMELAIGEEIGIISRSQKNNQHFYDRFRNRIIFPIINAYNQPIAFGGRAIDNSEPKYLNSPESKIFHKRDVLYGFNIAKEHIRDLDRAIVVEGYLDVIGCHQAGIQNVIAPLGTALTTNQLEILSRLCNEIILLFDADSAGMKAALRSLDNEKEINAKLKVAMLPEDDPFDFVLKKGAREFMIIIDSALKPNDFKIKRILDLKDSYGPMKTLMYLFSVIKGIPFETERGIYLKKISDELQLNENAVRTDFAAYLRKQTPEIKSVTAPGKSNETKLDYLHKSMRDLIRLICHYPEIIDKAVIDFSTIEITDPVIRSIYNKIIEIHSSGEEFSVNKMFDFFQKGSEMEFLNKCIHEEYKIDNPNAVYTEIYINMKLHEIDEKINTYAQIIKNSNNINPQDYITEIEVLRREKEKLSHYIYNRGIVH